MRIDRLILQNYKMFEHFDLELKRPEVGTGSIHVLVGENGSGKTSVIMALRAALGIWYMVYPPMESPPSELFDMGEEFRRSKVAKVGDRFERIPCLEPTTIEAHGELLETQAVWRRTTNDGLPSHRALDPKTANAVGILESAVARASSGPQTMPVVASYSAYRGQLRKGPTPSGTTSETRWVAFHEAHHGVPNFSQVYEWVLNEYAMKGATGRARPGFEAVLWAIRECVEGAREVTIGLVPRTLLVDIDGELQPFVNLSQGYAALVGLVADLAIRIVTLNAHLVPSQSYGNGHTNEHRVLLETPGVVLIDEIDTHLHPRWQRTICATLRRVFPSVQFVVTTHSPIVISEMAPEEIIVLERKKNEAGELSVEWYHPLRARGMDVNSVVESLMGGKSRTDDASRLIDDIRSLIADHRFADARARIDEFEKEFGKDPEVADEGALLEGLERLHRG